MSWIGKEKPGKDKNKAGREWSTKATVADGHRIYGMASRLDSNIPALGVTLWWREFGRT